MPRYVDMVETARDQVASKSATLYRMSLTCIYIGIKGTSDNTKPTIKLKTP